MFIKSYPEDEHLRRNVLLVQCDEDKSITNNVFYLCDH